MNITNTESQAIFNMRFLSVSGEDINVPEDWTLALIEIQGETWKEMELVCKQLGKRLLFRERSISGRKRIVADWPRVGPGNYHLALYSAGELLIERVITVLPMKISLDAYVYMLEDLDHRLPASIALSLQQAGALADVYLLPPGQSTLAQELVRLRRAIRGIPGRPGLTQILRNLATQPHQVFTTSEVWVQRKDAWRPHPSRLVQAMARPGNLDAKGIPLKVIDTRVEHVYDTYENRLLKFYCQQVDFRVRKFTEIVGAMANKNPKSTNLQTISTDIQSLQDELALALRSAHFLEEVHLPASAPTHITMVLSQHPFYRATLEGFLELQKNPSVRLAELALEAPLENIPKLYQVWCTLHTLDALLKVGIEKGYKIEGPHLAKRDKHGIYLQLLSNGQPVATLIHPEHGTKVQFTPERTYSSKKTEALHSITFTQRPDIAVEMQSLDKSTRIYIFDPKYKLSDDYPLEQGIHSGPKREDIDTMHVYRDAIRDQQGNRVVDYATILYPGQDQFYSDGIEALRAYPEPQAVTQLKQRLHKVFAIALNH